MEKNIIYNEDCLIGMQNIPDKSVDCIICDLPYGSTACSWDIIIPFDKLWEQYKRIIKDNGAIVLFGSQPFTSSLVMSNPKWFKCEWIWQKHKGTNFNTVKRYPMKVHESIVLFSNGRFTYNPQMTEGVPYKKRGEHNVNKNGGMFENKKVGYAKDFDSSKRYPISIQQFSNHNQKDNSFHPTQKPVPLLEYLIKTYTNEGETVLDNCMGSGTTAVAAINTSRNYIGFETDKTYYQIACDRIREALREPKLAI